VSNVNVIEAIKKHLEFVESIWLLQGLWEHATIDMLINKYTGPDEKRMHFSAELNRKRRLRRRRSRWLWDHRDIHELLDHQN